MKKLILLLSFCAFGLFCQQLSAQTALKANVSSQPIWGPVGYDYVEYYYLPDIDTYYYVPKRKYIYSENGRWISKSHLPKIHKNYDMYNARKIVVNEPKPYLHHQDYKTRYVSSDEFRNQPSIRDSRESKYFKNKNHPEHSKWRIFKRYERRNRILESGSRSRHNNNETIEN